MTMTARELYELLPAIYRIRDTEQGEPLKALLSVMASQINVVEEDIDQLYENWFIETCEGWLVSYIGDLLGVRPLQAAGDDVFSLRAYVANTLAYRRRKGTVSVLEELARDVTGWPARAVEFFELLAASQHLKHLRPHRPAALQINGRGARNGLDLLGGPFEKAAHTVDVRRIESNRGKYNIPNVGLHLWRLKVYTVLRGTARAAAGAPQGCFHFNPLGYDAPLFNPPQTEDDIAHLADEINVPGMLRRLPLYLELIARRNAVEKNEEPESLYFGKNPVFEIFLDDGAMPLKPEEIVIANLEDWGKSGWKPPHGKDTLGKSVKTQCAVDPVLGRLALLDGVKAESVSVTFSYGFSGNVGGGPYDRSISVDRWYHPEERRVSWQQEVTRSPGGKTLQDAVQAWNAHSKLYPLAFGLITITDSCTYPEELPQIELPQGSRLAVVAAKWLPGAPSPEGVDDLLIPDNLRPHVVSDFIITKPSVAVSLSTAARGEFIADGLLVEGALDVKACNLGLLHLAHCTFAPSVHAIPPVKIKTSVSVASGNAGLKAVIDHCIAKSIRASETIAVLTITDSIIDGGEKSQTALAGLAAKKYGPVTEIERSTFFGAVSVRELYASETIFTGEVNVERCQNGCLRFSYLALPVNPTVTPNTPPRYRCQPCLEITTQEEKFKQKGKPADPVIIRQQVSLWLSPGFSSSLFGHPAYGQLSLSTPIQIRKGAQDGSEMGVFCHLKQPQREANLRGALIEYLRSGLAAGIFYVPQENHHTPGGSK